MVGETVTKGQRRFTGILAGDPEMLKMAIHNLLINAAHAMQNQGTIRIAVSADQAWNRVAISDEGPGIPAAIRDKIFAPFFTTKSRGTGLGLPTSKRFVEAHGGRLTIDSPPAGGTAAMIELPIN